MLCEKTNPISVVFRRCPVELHSSQATILEAYYIGVVVVRASCLTPAAWAQEGGLQVPACSVWTRR